MTSVASELAPNSASLDDDGATQSSTRATVIHNRAAGQAIRREAEFLEAIGVLSDAGWDLDVKMTSSGGHARDLASEAAASGAQVVIAAGGDGTVNEVIQGLAHGKAVLGCLPLGTVNVWAREAGFSANVAVAARELVTAEAVPIDLGNVMGRYFLLMAGLGLDASIVERVGDAGGRKQTLGVLPYAQAFVRTIFGYQGARFDVEANGTTIERQALMLVASNTRLYGGLAQPNRDALADDGLLDICLFMGHGAFDICRQILPFIRGRSKSQTVGSRFRAAALTVRSQPAVPIQIDGEVVGQTPVTISVEPTALTVLVGPGHERRLFSRSR